MSNFYTIICLCKSEIDYAITLIYPISANPKIYALWFPAYERTYWDDVFTLVSFNYSASLASDIMRGIDESVSFLFIADKFSAASE